MALDKQDPEEMQTQESNYYTWGCIFTGDIY